jgi:hypothetical protein
VQLPVPFILDLPPWGADSECLATARASAAATLRTLSVTRASQIRDGDDPDALAPLLDSEEIEGHQALLGKVRFVEISDGPDSVIVYRCRP